MKGIFTISLDFELHWGGFEKWPLNRDPNAPGIDYKTYFHNTRKVIPEMLELFQQHEVHVTWATVGMLFHRSKNELLANAPLRRPQYKVEQLSAYHYIYTKGIGANESDDPFHFAPSLIQKIINTPYQEIATHTFAHFYCNEEGQTVEDFREDLKAAQRIANTYGKQLKSLVFPRNQFNDQYLKVCLEEGITSVRSNPLDWFWIIKSTERESMWKRLNRGLDAYFSIGKKNTYKLDAIEVRPGYPACIPASRLLRPYSPKELILNQFKIARIKSEMTRAASNGEAYHLWWHPHNFGLYPTQSIAALKDILNHYAYCKKNLNMQSLSMGELATLVGNGK
ncbi:polysaccharide deacetylase family protein [Pseudochryseolinea flava]|uniref:Polysaccharide deacetylase n=1 Tax=Pseudochryseolinea flava TaxID=2059302 RepID=A0A364Y3I9_9BACT|nr:polysaccharide deacetylase family protein [Pseudochryseolinea flava]RAW01289.1 polysaccharide deacetylase [Pseudochryseolinea flava]